MPDYKCDDCKTPLGKTNVERYGAVLCCSQCKGAYRPDDGKRIELRGFLAFLENNRLLVRDAGLPLVRL